MKVLPLPFTGTTKAIILIMDKMGIAALSIGVNGATVPASVPQVLPNSQPVFMWKTGNSFFILCLTGRLTVYFTRAIIPMMDKMGVSALSIGPVPRC